MHILLAEDEAKVAKHIKQCLNNEGIEVELARNGEEAQQLAEKNVYDAWLFDVMMPIKDGVSVIRELRRQQNHTPAILITVKGEVDDRVHGLDAGADDYLVKPFSETELLARLRAVTRRQQGKTTTTLRVGDLDLDLLRRVAHRASKEIPLSNREFALLECLMSSSPRPVSKAALMERIWEQQFDPETNVLNVYINHLRTKIDLPELKPLIKTIRGVGFAVTDQEA